MADGHSISGYACNSRTSNSAQGQHIFARMTTYAKTIDLEVRDTRLLDLVAMDALIARIATGFGFTEGPVWDPMQECLILSDIIGNTMYRWSRDTGLQVFRRPSNMANGNTFDHAGHLLTCEHATSRVVRASRDGTVEVLATHYDDKELNSPNDLVVHGSGAIYFTDPLSGRSARYGIERPAQLGFQGVYQIGPDEQTIVLLADDFVLPNGLCFALDEQQVFVNDTRRGHIRVFDVRSDGTLANGRVWAAVMGIGEGAPDGMKLDQRGNLWCTGPGGIHVFAPDAACLGVLRVEERVANFAWGDADGHTLYMTASTSLYAVRTKIAGHQPV